MNPGLLSVVLPTYNHCHFLEESLVAVLGQSYSTLEFIVVDDGSTDGTAELLERYARCDPRVRVLRNPRNQGIIPSVAWGRAEARGEFLCFASSDDRILPGFFEKTIRLLQKNPTTGLCWTDPSHFFESSGPIYPRRAGLSRESGYVSPESLVRLYREGRLSAPLYSAPAMYRRSDFEAAGGLLADLRWYSDFFVTLVVALRTGLAYVPEALTSTRIQAKSYSRQGAAQKEIQRQVMTHLLDLFLSDAYRDVAPLVARSGLLSYFGWPMFRLADRDPRYRPLLDRRFLRRALRFTFQHEARKMIPAWLQRCFFRARVALKSRARAGPGGPPG